MIRAGLVIENPITRSRTLVVESDVETNGQGWLLEVTCVPHARPDISEHLHLTWTERFEILRGTAFYKLNGVQKQAQAGEVFTVLPGQHHIHPWNAGDTELVYRQQDDFGEANPQAVQDVLGVFATIAQLAQQGKIDERGLPKNPLQLAASLKILNRHGGYDSSLPIAVQKLLSATLGSIAELLGYKGIDPQLFYSL
jgi:quercetin dioxygenase-like cupin family protein